MLLKEIVITSSLSEISRHHPKKHPFEVVSWISCLRRSEALANRDLSSPPYQAYLYVNTIYYQQNSLSPADQVALLESFIIATLYHATDGALWTKGGDDWMSMTQTSSQLTWSIPTELATIVNLEDFLVGGNQLNGTLPRDFGAWTDMGKFQNDDFTVSYIVALSLLEEFHVDNHMLPGSIPEYF
jgi:hypothetical protein